MHDIDYQRRTDRYLALLSRHENTLFWLCFRHTRFRHDNIIDLMQDVRERLWRHFDNLPATATPAEEKRWVWLHIRSVLRDDHRNRKMRIVPIDHLADLPDDDSTSSMFMLLDELLALLPPDERSLLQALCQGITPEELAAERHQSLHTVQNLISIARQHLRQINEQYNKN